MMNVESNDRTLVRRAQSGEHGAFNILVRKYRHRVMKVSLRYTRNRADAEDAVQETFLKAYWGLPNFRGDAAFYSWLHRIAINSAKNVFLLRTRKSSAFAFDFGNRVSLRRAAHRHRIARIARPELLTGCLGDGLPGRNRAFTSVPGARNDQPAIVPCV